MADRPDIDRLADTASGLLRQARFKLAEASGYIRAVNVGNGALLATELDWLREDIAAHLDAQAALSAADRTYEE